ncbi:ergothioneine biosynthesis glutamate--cysteine ligase EgtA [Kitasatospora sp. NPDC051170]|uniref:ergothioneine biosynthesis glutamate--cysteine ligase EgtA n=1 Tax=Kitasatospora sp. NPDC051170 TaxID=3364056 RepID=UPI0037BDCCE8
MIPVSRTTPADRPSAPPPQSGVTPLTESGARSHVSGVCFKIGPPELVGVEIEWFVHDDRCPDRPVPPELIRSALDSLPLGGPDGTSLPSGSRLTLEPGGQVELSSPPASGLMACVDDTRRDLTALRAAFAARGLRLTGTGTDPSARPREMVLDHPRYLAMERFFSSAGPWGRIMMTGTASVQVCVDAGDADGPQAVARRWQLVHRLGPVLVAAFANSPVLDGKATGHRSTRQTVWSRMDPTRTLAPAPDHGDPGEAWAQYVLDAQVLCMRRPEGLPWTAPPGLTFRDWIRGGGERPPTLADLDYHRTTLFPPVRPHGYLELRMIDAQPGDGWMVPAALVTALLDDPLAAEATLAALEPLERLERRGHPQRPDGREHPAARAPRSEAWRRAATLAVADPELRRATLACFAAADAALGRMPGAERLRATVGAFAERYPARGRCPADDQLDALRAGTRRTPPEEPAP